MAKNGNNGRFTRGDPRAGRPPGSPNKVTAAVRESIAAFAEANVEKLQTWLEAIADKDPAKAADLYVRVLEYHVPKLARTELSGEIGVRGKLIIGD